MILVDPLHLRLFYDSVVFWPLLLLLVAKGRGLSALSDIAMQWQLRNLRTLLLVKETLRSAENTTHTNPPREQQ